MIGKFHWVPFGIAEIPAIKCEFFLNEIGKMTQ
jgi:hypothetical protein